ncbi:hypothetical protein SUDANB1_00446 [Streptomyces sp. enrichment culture]|uniref:hypothetical protein n=1 Tax=Streptomyces sp. enrichment culture TaxID=1795815 RepID=UPI003F56D248
MRLRLILPAVAAGLALTACTSSGEQAPDPADTVAVQPTTTADDLDGHTRQTFEITWAMASDAQRQTYCDSVTLLTPDQAAASMRNGASGDDSLDWPLMVELLEDECALR